MWSSDPFDLSQRRPVTLKNFFLVSLPPVVLYHVTNILAILGPRTFFYRLALLPVTLLLAYRATVLVDIAKGLYPSEPEKFDYMNQASVLVMFTVLTRSLVRTFGGTPRRTRGTSEYTVPTRKQLVFDAFDLTFGLRGIGWNFSANMKVAAYTRPLDAYIIPTLRSLAMHVVVFDFLHYFAQCIGPDTLGSTAGGSIYDMSISDPFVRCLRSTALTFLVGLLIYGAIQIGHDVFSLIAVTLFRQSPAEWPPLFDGPWFATSLTDFWAARWHQVFRQDFIAIGARPMYLVAGRSGAVIGAFLVSGMLHYVGLWGMAKGADVRVIYFFLVMAVGVILEAVWRHFSGSRVQGWMGWIWTCVWILRFGPLMTDPWCISGIMGSVFLPQPIRPSVRLHRFLIDIYHNRNSTY
ncbi:membrane bound O-acyl transferase family-domain-containing protein [Mycena maculata]|uniref:Membrane bound O-acyl transferase family-domain-containing protein n=1 Tax=Mycena maculata TaxID=230809 RepID=A0AAD7HB89_9AGAR|nr:membrane bound O-acyl transferase family-domain-containing protein [Mycena maculata]